MELSVMEFNEGDISLNPETGGKLGASSGNIVFTVHPKTGERLYGILSITGEVPESHVGINQSLLRPSGMRPDDLVDIEEHTKEVSRLAYVRLGIEATGEYSAGGNPLHAVRANETDFIRFMKNKVLTDATKLYWGDQEIFVSVAGSSPSISGGGVSTFADINKCSFAPAGGQKDFDKLFLIDLSGSMDTEDFSLEGANDVIQEVKDKYSSPAVDKILTSITGRTMSSRINGVAIGLLHTFSSLPPLEIEADAGSEPAAAEEPSSQAEDAPASKPKSCPVCGGPIDPETQACKLCKIKYTEDKKIEKIHGRRGAEDARSRAIQESAPASFYGIVFFSDEGIPLTFPGGREAYKIHKGVLGETGESIAQAIRKNWHGMTNLGDALTKGIDVLVDMDAKKSKQIVLVVDGMPENIEDCREIIKTRIAPRKDISLKIIGMGSGPDDKYFGELASLAGGEYKRIAGLADFLSALESFKDYEAVCSDELLERFSVKGSALGSCPDCGASLSFYSSNGWWFCDPCKKYVAMGESAEDCTGCGKPLSFLGSKQKWYCYDCRSFAKRTG